MSLFKGCTEKSFKTSTPISWKRLKRDSIIENEKQSSTRKIAHVAAEAQHPNQQYNDKKQLNDKQTGTMTASEREQ